MSKKRLLDFEATGEPLVFSHHAAFAGDLLVCHGTVVIGNMGRPVNVTATRSHDGRWNVEFQSDGSFRSKALADTLARYYDAQQYGELLVDTLLNTKVTRQDTLHLRRDAVYSFDSPVVRALYRSMEALRDFAQENSHEAGPRKALVSYESYNVTYKFLHRTYFDEEFNFHAEGTFGYDVLPLEGNVRVVYLNGRWVLLGDDLVNRGEAPNLLKNIEAAYTPRRRARALLLHLFETDVTTTPDLLRLSCAVTALTGQLDPLEAYFRLLTEFVDNVNAARKAYPHP